MNVVVALTVFAAIFPSELPDKTFIATLVLSTRFAPLPVWVGAAAAFAVQTAVAIAAGGALSLLPRRPVHAVAALLFVVTCQLCFLPAWASPGALADANAGSGTTTEPVPEAPMPPPPGEHAQPPSETPPVSPTGAGGEPAPEPTRRARS